MLTVNTAPSAQAVIGGKLLAHGLSLRAANAADNEYYQRNRRLLLDELDRRFPRATNPGVTWNAPDGGFFAVLELPFEAGDPELERCARDHAVLFTPMHHFHGDGRARRRIRLAFSNVSPRQITDGVGRLAGFVRAMTTTTTPEHHGDRLTTRRGS
jgi:(S)-3,5-dihydroxyphenylglycine transaminase